jgi:Dolichyl-phosphate-mannose-protein mannosyltransferase
VTAPDTPRRGRALLGAVFVGLSVAVALWLSIDRRPPEWDHANHLERAVLCARDLRAADLRAILDRSSFYPPLALCLTGALSLALPVEAAAGVVMLAFLAVGMAAVHRLGHTLGGEDTGVTAALMFATAPFAVYLLPRLQLDLPLAAMVALALSVLLATEHFGRLGPSLAFGVVCGLGMLTKPTFALYVAPPALWLLAGGRRRALSGAGLAVLVAAALSVSWYGPRLFGLGAQLEARSFAQAAEAGHPDPLTLTGLAFYPRWLGYQIGVGAAALSAVGVLVTCARRRFILLVAAGAPFVVLELIRNKNLRYALPLLGVLAVLAALGLQALPRRLYRVAVAVLVVLGIAQVSAVLGGVPPNVWVPGLGVWWVPASPPQRADWRHAEILALLERERRGAPATVSVVPNFDRFSVSNFRFYAVRDGLDLRFVRAWDDPPLGIDYMILKTGDQGPSWTETKSRRAVERLAADPHLARVFPVIAELPLPDGSTASVRARRVPAASGATTAELAAAVEAGLRRRLSEVARDVEGLQVQLVHDDGILGGRVRRVEVRAASARLGEFMRPGTPHLRVHDLHIVLDEVLVNPWSALAEDRFDPLDAGRLSLERATVTLADLQAYLGGLRRFRHSTVRADGDAVAVTIRQAGPDVSARVRMLPAADRPFALAAEQVRAGGVPIPDVLVNWVIRNFDPTPRIASRMPFPVQIAPVSVRDGALRISSER